MVVDVGVDVFADVVVVLVELVPICTGLRFIRDE
jgi:hypothetical protein